MSSTKSTVIVFHTNSSFQSHPESARTLRNGASHALETNGAPAEPITVETTECDGLEEGYFVACLSCDDPSTPFWVGKIASFQESEKGTTNVNLPKMIRVHWYQASGSARDPFDAAYTPARKPNLVGGHGGSSSFWESVIGHTDIVTKFPNLTSENRLDKETVAKIKNTLYK